MDHDKRIDKSITFVPVNIAILTVSDSRKADDDRSGDLLVGRVQEDGHNLAGRAIVTDDFDAITKQLASWVEDKAVDVIVATGGTGLTGRDGTPEAFRAIFEKEIEGFGELFRYISFAKIGTSTVQSRAVAGVAGGTYLFSLPGSTWTSFARWVTWGCWVLRLLAMAVRVSTMSAMDLSLARLSELTLAIAP